MRFSTIVTALALAARTFAQLPPSTVVDNLNALTDQTQALIAAAQQLSISNAPQLLLGRGPWPAVLVGLGGISTTATNDLTLINGGDAANGYSGTAADDIAGAFKKFVAVNENLLNILIGKAGLVPQVPFVGPPVATVLRDVEGVVDTLATSLIGLVQGSANAVIPAGASQLDNSFEKAIAGFSTV